MSIIKTSFIVEELKHDERRASSGAGAGHGGLWRQYHFCPYAPDGPGFLGTAAVQQTSEAERALESIAAALRWDTDDFTCIDEIIAILEPLDYQTVPRHVFG